MTDSECASLTLRGFTSLFVRAASLRHDDFPHALRGLLEALERGEHELVSFASIADARVCRLKTIHEGVNTLKRIFAKKSNGLPAPHEGDELELDHVRLDLAVDDERA